MIANTFIKRPVTAIVISIVLVITGTICIAVLPIDQYPDITPPLVGPPYHRVLTPRARPHIMRAFLIFPPHR